MSLVRATVREVINSIKTEPQLWNPTKGGLKWDGVIRDNIRVAEYGNPKILSVIELEIKGTRIQLSWFDAYYLEKTVQAWYKKVPLEQF